VWPAEPVVAKAYIDQLARSGVISQSQVEAMNEALASAEENLAAGNNDRRTARRLETLAGELSESVASASGITRSRYVELASTIEAIAERLR
jgi:multidrug resistance efflux pump